MTKDNDYLQACVDGEINDPFLVLTERMVDAEVLRVALPGIPEEKRKNDGLGTHMEKLNNGKMIEKFKCVPLHDEKLTPIGETLMETSRIERMKDFLNRLVISLPGGSFSDWAYVADGPA